MSILILILVVVVLLALALFAVQKTPIPSPLCPASAPMRQIEGAAFRRVLVSS